MLFDRLCGISERHIPEFHKVLSLAHITKFPDGARTWAKGMDPAAMQWCIDNFRLPSPLVVIERGESCVVLMDSMANQVGFTAERGFIECHALNEYSNIVLAPAQADKGAEEVSLQGKPPEGTMLIRTGSFNLYDASPSQRDDRPHLSGALRWWMIADKHQIMVPARNLSKIKSDQAQVEESLRAAALAVEEILVFSRSAHYGTVERSPVHARLPKKGRILRSTDRPHFEVMPMDDIVTAGIRVGHVARIGAYNTTLLPRKD